MTAEESESQNLFDKMAYKTSPNKGKRIFCSIQLHLFILKNIRNLLKKQYKIHIKLTEYELFCGKQISAKIKQKLKKFLKIMTAPRSST